MKLPVSNFLKVIRIEKNILSISKTGGKNLKYPSFMSLFFKAHFLKVSFFSAFQNVKKNIFSECIFSLFFNNYLNKIKVIDKCIFHDKNTPSLHKKYPLILNFEKLILKKIYPSIKEKKLIFIKEKAPNKKHSSFSTLKYIKKVIDSFKIQNIKKHIKSNTLIKNHTFQRRIKPFDLIIFKNQKMSFHRNHLITKKTAQKVPHHFITLIKLPYKRNCLIIKNKIIAKYNLMNLKYCLKNEKDFFLKYKSKIILYKIQISKKLNCSFFNPLLSLKKQFAKKNFFLKIKNSNWQQKIILSIQYGTKPTYQFFNKTLHNKLILKRFYQFFEKSTSFLTKIKRNNQLRTQLYRLKQTILNNQKEKINDRNIYGYCCS